MQNICESLKTYGSVVLGMRSAQSEPAGWNAVVQPLLTFAQSSSQAVTYGALGPAISITIVGSAVASAA